MSVAGEARAALKWADGKVIKNEVDMQVCLKMSIFVIEYLDQRLLDCSHCKL